MGLSQRNKGRKGQREAKLVLQDRDFNVIETNSGTAVEDFVAIDKDGKTWSVEVKNTISITTAHRKQAIEQSKARRLPWLLISKIAGTSSWLVQRQGERPVVWHEEKAD